LDFPPPVFFLTIKGYSINPVSKRYDQNAIFKCWKTDSSTPQRRVRKDQFVISYPKWRIEKMSKKISDFK
jgi:hypothetical protein